LSIGENILPSRYKLIGPDQGRLYVVLGGISASCDVVSKDDGSPGWWSWLIGPGKTIDTNQVRVLSFDFVTDLPVDKKVISTFDQALALKNLLKKLKIEKIDTILGASYGGMVGLAFAALFSSSVRELVVVAATHKNSPFSIAYRVLQRKIVLGFSSDRESSRQALSLARSLATLTYRTGEEFNQRFSVPALSDNDDPDSFAIWSYLKHQGDKFAEVTDPAAFVNLSRSIDHHFVEPSSIIVPMTLIGFASDILVPFSYFEELAAKAGAKTRLVRIDSPHGHDAFLKDDELRLVQELKNQYLGY